VRAAQSIDVGRHFSTAIDQATDAILTLINSKPRSPTKDELAAIIANVASPAPDAGVPKLQTEWDALLADSRAAEAGDESEKGDAVVQAASGRLDDCVRRILRRPVRGLADIRLLAEALHWRLWTDPAGITEKNLAEGPSHADMDAESTETLAALLKGIRDVTHAASPPASAGSSCALSAEQTETWGYQSIGAWRYLEAEWERYDFVTRVGAKVVPGDPHAKAFEEKKVPSATLYTLRRSASWRAPY